MTEKMRFTSLALLVALIALVTSVEHISLQRTVLLTPTPPPASVFKNVVLEAKAAYVYDVKRKKMVFGKNENIALPLASLTKLMTSLVALSTAPRQMIVTVGRESVEKEGDTGLYPGELWSLERLIEFTLTTSSNDGAHAIAAAIAPLLPVMEDGSPRTFATAMNDRARTLGLTGMYFTAETGLDKEDGASAYGSAKETALLLSYFLTLYPDILEPSSYASPSLRSENTLHSATNTNKEAQTIPGLLASKTGFTDIAGGNLAIAIDVGLDHPVIVVVLGSTQEGRFSDAKKLATLATEEIAKNRP